MSEPVEEVPTAVRSVPLVDRVDDADGRAVVMVGQQVVAVSPLGALLLDLCREGRRVDDALVAEVVRRLGDPGGGQAVGLVQDAVSTLVDAGLLVTFA